MSASNLSPRTPPHARDRLLDAATVLFASHGYHAIGLRDLAGHIGLHAGSLYHHIENKQSLLFELIESALNDLIYGTRRQLKRGKNDSERLQLFVQAFVAFSIDERNRLVLLTRDAVYLTADQAEQIEQMKSTYTEELASIVSARLGQARQRGDLQVRFVAGAIVGMLFGQSQWEISNLPPTQLSNNLSAVVAGMIETCKQA